MSLNWYRLLTINLQPISLILASYEWVSLNLTSDLKSLIHVAHSTMIMNTGLQLFFRIRTILYNNFVQSFDSLNFPSREKKSSLISRDSKSKILVGCFPKVGWLNRCLLLLLASIFTHQCLRVVSLIMASYLNITIPPIERELIKVIDPKLVWC